MIAHSHGGIDRATVEGRVADSGVRLTPQEVDAVVRSLARIQIAAAALLQSRCLTKPSNNSIACSRAMPPTPPMRSAGERSHDADVAEAAAAIAQGRLRAEALVEACLDRVERLQPALNCFIRVTAEAARGNARAADMAVKAGHALGPLHGVPLAHKDMFYRAGEICSCGSKIRANFVPDHTATVLRRLDAAGGIDLGRLNMAEFALGPTGHNDHFGRCRNPWSGDRITGGSSSGSGAAVAAGLAFGALGSDTGGSVRLPAAACGVVGIKPTQGRVSRYGAMPLSHSLDCIGLLARAVGDCARLLSVIAGADDRDGMASRRAVPDYERGLHDAGSPGRSRA